MESSNPPAWLRLQKAFAPSKDGQQVVRRRRRVFGVEAYPSSHGMWSGLISTAPGSLETETHEADAVVFAVGVKGMQVWYRKAAQVRGRGGMVQRW